MLNGLLYADPDKSWAEKTLESLTLKEKIGQLIIISTQAHRDLDGLFFWCDQYQKVEKEYGIGGLLFLYKNDPFLQIQAINTLNARSKLPLLITLDAEWGIAMRHEGVQRLPYACTLAAITDLELIKQAGAFLAEQCRLVGVHINLAPVVDLYSNKSNPIVNKRCFGADVERVCRYSNALLESMQTNGVYGSAKHFPGHGNTAVDSHKALPVIHDSLKAFEASALLTFKAAIQAGVKSIMTAHLLVPAFDAVMPTSLSPAVYSYLRTELNFDGLIISDSLSMKALSGYTNDQVAVAALKAGVDLLLRPIDPYAAAQAIEHAVQDGSISEQDLDEHVLRVLRLKEEVCLPTASPLASDNAQAVIKLCNESPLIPRLYQAAITLVRDPSQVLASKHQDYVLIELVAHKWGTPPYYGALLEQIDQAHKVLESGKPVVVVVYGDPHIVEQLPVQATVIVAYEDVPYAHEAVHKLLTKQIWATGILPIAA